MSEKIRKQVPQEVIDLVKARTAAADQLSIASGAVDAYCESIGLDSNHPLFDEACLVSDVRIYCEVGASESTTLRIIEKVLNGEVE